jgi:hypothetical protein
MKINLKRFIELLNKYEEDIGSTKNEDGNIYSHNIEGTITIMEEGEEEDTFYNIKDIEVDHLLGCRCSAGITIIVEKEKD